ncbi:MAG: enoyl-CoA hydratase/isomerase family protein [Pirellulaceae bacterium]
MINVKVHESSGTIMLDRPQRCNALSRNLVAEISQAIDDLRQEKRVRGIILTGSGAHFCAGLDIQELRETAKQDNSTEIWFEDARAAQQLVEQMLQCPKPIIAAIDGAAVGMGLTLALASDLIVASHRATFSVPAARLGIVAGLAIPLLNFRLGASTASRVLLGGAELDSKDAKQLGLAHHVVDSEQVWVRSSTWVSQLAENAPEAMQLTKRVLNEMVGEQLSTWLSSGAAATATSMTTEAAEEGITAAIEKRAPKFL